MVPDFPNSYSNSCSFWSGNFDPFVPGFDGVSRGGPMGAVSQALVLDSEKGELVKAPTTTTTKTKEISEAKTVAALKSHSEAERRRRERINAHLATLRALLPSSDKMDKATLLGEVINQVKILKQNAMDASKGLLIPMDDDEVKVEPYRAGNGGSALTFKASLCCEYRPELMSDIIQAIASLQLKLVDAEISSLGGRMKSVLILGKGGNDEDVINIDGSDHSGKGQDAYDLVSRIRQAFTSILEKGFSSPEYTPRTTLSNKKRRLTYSHSSSSSS